MSHMEGFSWNVTPSIFNQLLRRKWPGAKCSHQEKLSRLGECPCLQRRDTRVNSCPGASKISCEQHYSFIKEPRQFLSRDNCLPRDITLSRVHVKRALERCLCYNLVPRVFPLGTKGPCDLLKSDRFLINYLGSLSSAEVSMSFTWRLRLTVSNRCVEDAETGKAGSETSARSRSKKC
jgi:hypothetical protein